MKGTRDSFIFFYYRVQIIQ